VCDPALASATLGYRIRVFAASHHSGSSGLLGMLADDLTLENLLVHFLGSR